MIRIFIIDDHPLVISGLKNMFRKDRDNIEVSGSALDVSMAMQEAKPTSFDIILLDLWIRDTNPLENIRMLKRKFPFKPIVILTYEDSAIWQRRMYNSGAAGYLLKTSKKAQLREALEKVADERIVFPHLFEEVKIQRDQSAETTAKIEKLTTHQHEVVSMLCEGNSRSQIGQRLSISISTIEKILTSIRKKFQARTNSQLIWLLSQKKIL
ncbi:MAG: response regulator transcription factor [Bacteroidetes bacterium]|nr:response regulator transcription factor [Bacteroidota bacterium]